MPVIVYGDFNCPYSLLASNRVDALQRLGMDVEWRAVEHAAGIPVTGQRLVDAARASVEAELADVRRLLEPGEEYPDTTPNLTPRTQAAVSAYSEAFGIGVGHETRRLLFDAYWIGHLDIGNAEVLRSLLAGVIRRGQTGSFPLHEAGYAVSVNRGPITVGAYRRIAAWRHVWHDLGSAVIPAVVDGSNAAYGVEALNWLARAVRDRAVDPHLRSPAGTASAA